MQISFESKGDFEKTRAWLNKVSNGDPFKLLQQYADEGTQALRSATPVRTGLTASSWYSTVEYDKNHAAVYWHNSNVNRGVNIAVIIQMGHGTGTGGYVQGIDYINPAMRPVFESLADKIWKAVIDV